MNLKLKTDSSHKIKTDMDTNDDIYTNNCNSSLKGSPRILNKKRSI